ncbi:MAG: DUF1573 domain-containing protein [Polaribacter sp.]|nr:DUF1573 domain-containing protein [Polaribacter sp.]
MKKTIVLSLLVVSLAFTACKPESAANKVNKEKLVEAQKRDLKTSIGAPVLKFDNADYNFGTVVEGAIVERTFVVTNTGKSPLLITDAITTCGCTVPSWPKDTPIAPGDSVDILVKFNTAGKVGIQSKTVTLFTNTVIGREAVRLKGSVTKKII